MSERNPGQVVAGKFRLKRQLGKGGMGSVWEAEHLGLRTDVAVKFIDAEIAASSENALARFAQEAKAAATIKSPHVCSVHDYGQDEEGNPYIAMELLVHGEPLSKRLERGQPMSLEDAKVLVTQSCKALQKAHAAGYIHRDLKPDNIFLCEEDEGFSVKILDFGLAKETGGLAMTGAGQVVGTPDYMSPEQARGKDVDFRTDFWSLGVILYECLTGRVPFEGKTLPDLMIAIVSKEAALASTFRTDLPAGIVTWLHRALQKEPTKRFDSAKEMAAAFTDGMEQRRMVVNVPRISVADEEEVRGEDITVRAVQSSSSPPPASLSSADEDRTLRDMKETGFRVDRTMPLGSDSAMFAAARMTPPPPTQPSSSSKDRIPAASGSDHVPAPMPRSSLPPFWVILIALLCIVAAIFMFLKR